MKKEPTVSSNSCIFRSHMTICFGIKMTASISGIVFCDCMYQFILICGTLQSETKRAIVSTVLVCILFHWCLRSRTPSKKTKIFLYFHGCIFFVPAGATQVRWNRLSRYLLATAHDGDIKLWDQRKGTAPVQYIAAHLAKVSTEIFICCLLSLL